MEREERKVKARVEKQKDSKQSILETREDSTQVRAGVDHGKAIFSSIGNRGMAGFFQAKLEVGSVGDRYEQEADRVAEKMVTDESSPALVETTISKVQAKGNPSGKQVSTKDESKIKEMESGGKSLDKGVRDYFEPRFGVDLGNVNIHTDSKADNMAKTLNARAITYGNNIAFAKGEYQPDTVEGKKLIAHELTHVQQQAGGTVHRSVDNEAEAVPDAREVDRFPEGFDPAEKADELHEAFDGWGTDERAVLDILTTGRADMTRAIEAAYNEKQSPQLEKRIREELSGKDLDRALILLESGKLSISDKVREVLRDYVVRGDLNTKKLYHDLERANSAELAELNADAKLIGQMGVFLPPNEWTYVKAYLSGGQGILAAQLLNAVNGWGTDEKLIWLSIEQASEEERQFILSQPKLIERIEADLNEDDCIQFRKSLEGDFGNLDRIVMATNGWGTDENQLLTALKGLSRGEFGNLPGGVNGLIELLESELSGDTLEEAKQVVHQKRLEFDEEYKAEYLEKQQQEHGGSDEDLEGMSVLIADTGSGESLSVVDKLKNATAGWGTDEKEIWHVLNTLTAAQRSFLLKNPEGVLDTLKGDLSTADYQKVLNILKGGAESALITLKEAIGGWGNDERLIYDTIDRAISEGLGKEILADVELKILIVNFLTPMQHEIFTGALKSGNFTPMMRLQWATTAMAGTDEDLVYELCKANSNLWYHDGNIITEVDNILQSELNTRDYWRALDSIRPEPSTEEEKIARAKEELERERGGLSGAIMDALSYSGENADDAWRDYNSTYNQAIEDGKLTAEEQEQITRDEEYSKAMTEEYRAAKESISHWASTIAVAIVGVVATILTAGAAGPLVVALGGKVLFTATAMVTAAALKVGINKAIQGEGYDVTSTQALVDAISASVEVGLSVVGGQVASKFMQGLGKTAMVKSIAPSVQRAFGDAGTRILNAGIEGAIDATIGGVGEGIIQGLAQEETWANGIEGFFTNMAKTTATTAAISSIGGFVGGAGFKSITEVVGNTRVKGKVPDEPTIRTDEPTIRTEEPTVKTEEPTVRTEEPTVKTEEPTVRTEEPTVKTEEPTVRTEEPTVRTEEPTVRTEEPTVRTEEPTVRTEEPTVKTEEPTVRTEEPTVKTEEPTVRTEEPTVRTEEPTVRTEEPTDYIDDPLYKKVDKDAQRRIDDAINGKTKPGESPNRLIVSSRAAFERLGLETEEFNNIYIKLDESIDGITILDDKMSFTIDEPDKIMQLVSDAYEDSGNPLTQTIRERIEQHLGSGGKIFPRKDGIPGLHGEVLAVNNIIDQIENLPDNIINDFDFKEIKVATIKISNPHRGEAFKACSNCGAILDQITIITGR